MSIIDAQEVPVKKKRGFALHPENINKNGYVRNPEKRALENALRDVRRNHKGIDFLHHVAELAFTDKSFGLAVLDKLIPDAAITKDMDEQKESPKFVLVFNNDGNKNLPQASAAEVHQVSQEIPRDVLVMGDRQDVVPDRKIIDIHGTPKQQPGSDLSQGVHRSEELNVSGLREVFGIQDRQQPNGHEPENQE